MSDTAAFLKSIAHDPYDPVAHQVLADHLRETHGDSPLWDRLQRTAAGEHGNEWWEFCDNSYDAATLEDPDYRADTGVTFLGRHGPFNVYHDHEGGPQQNQRHVVTLAPTREVRRQTRQYPVYHLEVEHGADFARLADALRETHGRLGDNLWSAGAVHEAADHE